MSEVTSKRYTCDNKKPGTYAYSLKITFPTHQSSEAKATTSIGYCTGTHIHFHTEHHLGASIYEMN